MIRYEGQQQIEGKTWIVVVGMRKDRDEVLRLINQAKQRDSSLGGMIAPTIVTGWRIVTWERKLEELV